MSTIQQDAEVEQATDADMLRTLAAASAEGLPYPTGWRISPYSTSISVHTHNRDERDQWQQWWTRHGVTTWTVRHSTSNAGAVHHHYVVGVWRGWEVELVHLTRQAPPQAPTMLAPRVGGATNDGYVATTEASVELAPEATIHEAATP